MDFLTEAFRNLARRKIRTLLSISGVAVGIFAFLLMGSMAEHFHRIAIQFESIFQNRIFVCERISFWAGGGILSELKARKVAEIPGVATAAPVLIFRQSDERIMVIGIPAVVVGTPSDKIGIILGRFRPAAGKISLPSEDSAVIGFDTAKERNLSVGDSILVKDREFKVVGIVEKTGGLFDNQIYIQLKSAQEIYDRQGLITSVFVVPESGVNMEELSAEIKSRVSGVEVISPEMFKSQIRSSLAIWKSLTWGGALTACIAGGLCIIITMLASVSERTIEIGIKKALGASDAQIMMEFLVESLSVSTCAWVTGGIASWFFVFASSKWLSSMGSNLFELTPRLFIYALLGGIMLGLLAGLYPAWRAVRIQPVEALKIRY